MTFIALTYTPASQSIIRSKRRTTSSKSRYSPSTAPSFGATCSPLTSSRPPLIAYSRHLARLARAPKNCICLPTSIGDTQQAIAPSSPQERRMVSSLSNWIELVSIATFATKRRNASGRRGEYSTVRFGSGAGPRL